MNDLDQEIELEKIRAILSLRKVEWTEKKMFGGYCFMVENKMCFGTYKKGLMVRIHPNNANALAKRRGAEQMIHNGRRMKGYCWVAKEGYARETDLDFWISECLAFNPLAKSSKKKKK